MNPAVSRAPRAPVFRVRRAAVALAAVLLAVVVLWWLSVAGAAPAVADTLDPAPDGADNGLSIEINGPDGTPSSSVLTLLGLGVLMVAPSLVLMCTSFTKVFVVLAMTRNALGLNTTPPTQVLAGIALILTIFIMQPVISEIIEVAITPYADGEIVFTEAVEAAQAPLREWMLPLTREEDIALMTRSAGLENPATPADTPLTTLIPAFVISELRAAFIIGFVIFVPFLIIDLVVSSALMSMGMMMLPPVMVSLPFKILLFVLVDGWGLIISSLVGTYNGAGG
ncbi:flagellar type III secretion system pore protein FliP [Citricoccus sp. I39-566]|uniref:flagellar type III secretion system pore protein FliP n=1 Tax=Citricoccus sp. I39-566 TaxID=3073268 RepID=UPI00286D3510|nr:flagellar type III secretion system pore protein FliP [Citricoccus sp. I39-566]WMY77968.1 flagellar type III secretion system pore protein FliP [Citricoccus sp. I39-566]